ncbi:cell separation during budding [Marasmius tenuissimus]|uniref:Cell separation during budding n=1 Tax=Marasmius tenuissimus TaxID=585030 RepID=A0ABR3A0F5_9AGAR
MSQARRLSQSFTYSQVEFLQSPTVSSAIIPSESEIWVSRWNEVLAKDIIDSRIVTVGADVSVEDACDKLLSEDIPCLAIQADRESHELSGLFDFADVNAFLTLAATKHTLGPEDLVGKTKIEDIFKAAKAGHVPVYLVSNLSEKNPLQILPHDATIVSLLERFAKGTHRVLVRSPPPAEGYAGIVSDRGLLSWFALYAEETPSLGSFMSDSLHNFAFPSLHIFSAVVAATSKSTVLEAMKLMSDEGVSSVAVLDEDTGSLLSAVSVTDIGKIVVPSQNNQILSTPLHLFVSYIKAPDGSMDGEDKFPVYSVTPNNTLLYAMQKILATNAHRVFVMQESSPSSSPIAASLYAGNLSGIISVVDILSLFARLANVQDVDPTRMQRHRRASSVSSQSSRSDRMEFNRSRSSSRASRVSRKSSMKQSHTHPTRNSVSGVELPVQEEVKQ